ncbi:hypothetical protein RHE_CH02926 [Rhizobium etli CFN 42]|uniref:Uncharacterized protein n=1 Tax=Rhizobium etli (strain ATCC 51251 / DSM 11541 / JCM 21823 / NBRC 15573 / CFN 42) TaxID=347834 RepID=Q2K643_RHIEC|nr:hypothetical protein RHE_CH02926 [Rhizobium etli CFN 42]
MVTKVVWSGKSGVQYTFEVYPVGQQFNPVSAVYIFCKLVGVGLYEALYVGEAQSLVDRINTGLMNHDGYKRASRLGANFVGVMAANGDAYRLSVETDLRHGLDPVCNRQRVPSSNSLLGSFVAENPLLRR